MGLSTSLGQSLVQTEVVITITMLRVHRTMSMVEALPVLLLESLQTSHHH